MSQPPNPDPNHAPAPNANANPKAPTPCTTRTIQQCHQCHTTLSLDPSQLAAIHKQQGDSDTVAPTTTSPPSTAAPPLPSLQCVYVKCPVRSAKRFACAQCSDVSQ